MATLDSTVTPNVAASSQPLKQSKQRDIRLDILRAVAVLLVLGRHAPIHPMWSRIGWCGVDLFFVLSGFLISGLLFKEYKQGQTINVKRFYIRRALKIYPSFYVLLAISPIGYWVFTGVPFHLSRFLAEALFYQNYVRGYWAHTWSLAVEEHFYLFLPGLLLLLSKTVGSFRHIPWIALTVALIALTLRIVNPNAGGSDYAYLFPTHLRIDSLMAGVCIGYFYHFRPDRFFRIARSKLVLPVACCLLAPICWVDVTEDWRMWSFGFTSTFLGFGCLLIWAMRHEHCRLENWISLRVAQIGAYSYSIYLWHMAVLMWGGIGLHKIATEVGPHALLIYGRTWNGVYVGGSVIFGIIMAKLIEVPVLAWRERRFPSTKVPLRHGFHAARR